MILQENVIGQLVGTIYVLVFVWLQGSFYDLLWVTPSDQFQICFINMYLVWFLANFVVFCVFLWISWNFVVSLEINGFATAQNIRSPSDDWFCPLAFMVMMEHIILELKSLHMSQVAHLARAYSPPPLDGRQVHHRVIPSIKLNGIHSYAWVEKGILRVKWSCPRTHHSVPGEDLNLDHSIQG